MVDFRLIKSSIKVDFELNKDGKFDAEFNSSRSSIEEWLSFEKAKYGGEDNELTLKLLVEIFKKLDELTEILNDKNGSKLKLENSAVADFIGYEGFKFKQNILQTDKEYFAKLHLPLLAHQKINIFFKAIDEQTARITQITANDEKTWSHFVAGSEMLLIRKAKTNGTN